MDLPNVVGAIDGTHIKIKTPKESGPDYFSQLQQHNVVFQAVADREKRFWDVTASFPCTIPESSEIVHFIEELPIMSCCSVQL